jgi:hypothetical protein
MTTECVIANEVKVDTTHVPRIKVRGPRKDNFLSTFTIERRTI